MKKKKGCCLSIILRFFFTLLVIGLVIIGYPEFVELKNNLTAGIRKSAEAFQEIPYQEVSVDEESLALHYYYGLLNEEEKQIYREIYQGMKERADEIYIH